MLLSVDQSQRLSNTSNERSTKRTSSEGGTGTNAEQTTGKTVKPVSSC
jgi:hypothetical protein